MPRYPGEDRISWLKRVAFTCFPPDGEHNPYYQGNVGFTASIVKVDRKHYPTQVYLRFKASNDGRIYTGVDLTWEEVENLHADLGRALKEREALRRKLRKAGALP